MRVDQLNRTRAHQPLGPRTSVSRGPVQGQPRIFASMNTGADFQQEPSALKRGQPRIFSTGGGQDPQPRSMNGPQPSPANMRGKQSQQEPPIVYNNRTGDIKGKGVDRSGTDRPGVDLLPEFQQHQQQPERQLDQRDNQALPQGQVGEPQIRTMYTEARSPAMEYRASLEKGRNSNRIGGNRPLNNRPAEPPLPLPPTNRPPIRRATEPHFEPPPPPLRKNSSGSGNEPQQRLLGSRGQSVDHQHALNPNGDNPNSKLNRGQSLYSPVVTIATNVPDTQPLNKPRIPSPKTVRNFGQRSHSPQREPSRFHSPPTPSFNAESGSPATSGYSGRDVNGSNPEPQQNRDPRGQSIGRGVQGSTGSLLTQDPSRKASLTSNTSVSSDREQDRSPTVVEPQPTQNRSHKSSRSPRLDDGQPPPPPTHRKSTKSPRLDDDQSSPPPTQHKSRERTRAPTAPTNRGSQMDSFYGGHAPTKKPDARNEEGVDNTDIAEEPEPYFYPLELHLLHPQLLRALLQYLTFYDWCILQEINKTLRSQLSHVRELKEEILERYLSTIGYARWAWEEDEPLTISLRVKSNFLLPPTVLTNIRRISTNICVAFRYPHMSTPGSQTTTCKLALPPFQKRRG